MQYKTPVQQEERHLQTVPFRHYRFVTVTFPIADADVAVEHDLPGGGDDVRYVVVQKDRACDIYNDLSAVRKPWGPRHVLLRSTVADATVRLLLFLEPTDA